MLEKTSEISPDMFKFDCAEGPEKIKADNKFVLDKAGEFARKFFEVNGKKIEKEKNN